MTTTCGSGSDNFNFIFTYKDGRYILSETLPEIGYFKQLDQADPIRFNGAAVFKKALEENWQPTYLFDKKNIINSGNILEVSHTDLDTFIGYKDLDNDNRDEIITALPIWEDGECHWCKHKWMVSIYKYQNDTYNIDTNFNDSLILTTSKKYDLYEIFGYKIMPENYLGIVSHYYGLGFMKWKTEELEPEFLIRKESKIWEIIKPHYK